MKNVAFATAVICMSSLGALAAAETPMAKVVTLLTGLKEKIEEDGQSEQKAYDKFACWCEDTLARKAKDVSDAKELITELENLIVKLKADLAAHAAEIEQLKKDIAANIESQREATEVRTKENDEYDNERTESEQCIGALEAAIKVLTGAGGGKKGFLETLQEAQLLSVVSGVRSMLKRSAVAQSLSSNDLEIVKRFVERPEDFVGGRSGALSAAQITNNPYGDYAPQSTQIQGILKGMYDSFTGDLEQSNAEEAEKQKSFEELMRTKKQEQETLETTLETTTMTEAEKTKQLAESKTTLRDTQNQLKADMEFFKKTKTSCMSKAGEWADRTRLRTEELQGIGKAIQILDSDSAKATFDNATTTFVQLRSVRRHEGSGDRGTTYSHLKNLATRYQSVGLAEIAAQVKTGGHFDKVIVMLDNMMGILRAEEQDDIAHRDRCQANMNANTNTKEDLEHDITKADASLGRMANSETELKNKIDELKGQIETTEDEMAQLLKMRNEDQDAFKQALKDDTDAIELVGQAIVSLTKFYKDNKIPLELRQEPEYTKDADKAPETWEGGGSYGGAKSQSGGIISILSMIKEDLENEVKTGRKEEAADQQNYVSDRSALQKTLESQKESKANTDKNLADLQKKISDKEEFKSMKNGDLDAEKETSDTVGHDCAWLDTHFDSRREKRKAEMDGVVEAKNFLAGVESGSDDLPPAF